MGAAAEARGQSVPKRGWGTQRSSQKRWVARPGLPPRRPLVRSGDGRLLLCRLLACPQMAWVDRLAVRELHLVPVRIAQQTEVADDGAGVDGFGDENPVGA